MAPARSGAARESEILEIYASRVVQHIHICRCDFLPCLPRLCDLETCRTIVRIPLVIPAFSYVVAGRMRASVRGGKPFANLLTGRPAIGPATLPPPVRQGPTVPGTTLLLAGAIERAAPGMAAPHGPPTAPLADATGFVRLTLPSCLN